MPPRATMHAAPRRPVTGPARDDVAHVAHPDHLRIGSRHLTLVDDPLTRRIQDGYGTLGWEGDARFAVYIDARAGEWVLVRLEHDGVYRVTTTTDPVAMHMAPIDVIGALLVWLVEHDGRRGFDPYAAVTAHNDARDAELAAAYDDEMANDIIPRLHQAFAKESP